MKNYKKELELQTINNDIQAKMQTIGTVLDDIQSDMTKMGEDIDSGLAQHTVITEIQSKYAHLVLTTIYRSPSGTDENDKAVNDLITDLLITDTPVNIGDIISLSVILITILIGPMILNPLIEVVNSLSKL